VDRVSDEIHFRYDPKRGYVECSAEEAWDSEKEKPMELGNAYIPPMPKLLTDTGTRFDHVNDLMGYLNDGLIAVDNSLERFENVKDRQRRKRLVDAISLIHSYQEKLANMDAFKWDLNNMLDKCVPERGVLEGIRKARIETLSRASAKSLLPEPPEEDTDPLGV
jgi:hypothetical protein